MKAYKPFYAREGNKIFKQWTEEFYSGEFKGIRTRIEFGKTKEKTQITTICVKWLDYR